jgi:hypothetical protein
LRRLPPSISRKLNKSHVAERAAVAARGFKGGRFRLFGQTFKAQRDRQNGPHIDECVASGVFQNPARTGSKAR